MKNSLVCTIGLMLMLSGAAKAQVTVTIGSPPLWGPVGYTEERYYYLPDVESYYEIQSSRFIYNQSGRWVYASRLPSPYRNYDLYNGYKIVMTGYRGNTPYDHFSQHKKDFRKGEYHGERQKTNGESPGNSKGEHGKSKEKSLIHKNQINPYRNETNVYNGKQV